MSPLQPQGLRGAVRLLGRPAMRGGPSHRKGLHARRVNCVGGSRADGAVSDLAGQVSEARQCRHINGVGNGRVGGDNRRVRLSARASMNDVCPRFCLWLLKWSGLI